MGKKDCITEKKGGMIQACDWEKWNKINMHINAIMKVVRWDRRKEHWLLKHETSAQIHSIHAMNWVWHHACL